MSLGNIFFSVVYVLSYDLAGTNEVYVLKDNGIYVPVSAEETTSFALIKIIRQMFAERTPVFTVNGHCSELMLVQDSLAMEAKNYSYDKQLTTNVTDKLCCLAYINRSMSLDTFHTSRSLELYNIPSRTCKSVFQPGDRNSWTILRDLSLSLNWRRFCILYTEEYGQCFNIISGGILDSKRKFAAFRIEQHNTDLLKKQLCSCIAYSKQNFKDFMIIADHDAVMSIFTQMQKLTREFQGLGQTARIFVFTQTLDKHSLITDISDSFLNVAFFQLLQNEVRNPGDNRTYSITSLVWHKKVREFQTSVTWDDDYNIYRYGDVFPAARYMLNNIHLRVTTKEWEPFTVKTVHNNGTITYTGLCTDLLDELAKRLNFSYTFGEPRDGQWGAVRNGYWTGMIGELVRKEVDVMTAAASAQKEREDVMDFTYPFFHDSSSMILKRSITVYDLWSKIFRPFHWTTILLLVGSIVVIGLVLSLMEASNPVYRNVRSYFSRWDTCVWYLLAALLREGGDYTAQSQAGRTVIATWWLFSIVIMAMYTGDLIGSFAVTTTTVPFNTLKGLTEQTTYKWGLEEGTYISMLLPVSSNDDYKAVWKGVQKFQQEDKSLNSSNITYHLDRVNQGNYVFLNDRSMLLLQAEKDCENLVVLKETFLTLQFAVGLHQNSTYREMFSEQILYYHEAGLIYALTKKWWPKNVTCDRKATKTETAAIGIRHMQGLYMVGLVVIITSGIILLCENVIFRLIKKNSNEQP